MSSVDPNRHHLETLSEIRSLMERSSRFISLSGLSGVVAGVAAMIGGALVYVFLGVSPFDQSRAYYVMAPEVHRWGLDYLTFFILDAVGVFILALSFGIFFTTRKARRKRQKIWDTLTRRLLVSLGIPLVTGGFFCLALLNYGLIGLVAPTTLIFYGLALVNASKFTLRDVHYLGLCEIALGLLATFYRGFGLEAWIIGFGFLHIIYGVWMYYKYEAGENKRESVGP
ncbi:MAG: hypothetical protein KDD19_13860 [Phaeodactylibacter sp.]|nr:hypothetical protein [Phaeodactylibacter sp.]MCB9053642.1 hypothetical protein [Lewinellaceae bacterium]